MAAHGPFVGSVGSQRSFQTFEHPAQKRRKHAYDLASDGVHFDVPVASSKSSNFNFRYPFQLLMPILIHIHFMLRILPFICCKFV